MIQRNHGRSIRAAAGNYCELHFGSSAFETDEERDRRALLSQEYFKNRFGCWALPEARKQLLEWQRKVGATDGQVRSLIRSGHLRIQQTGVRFLRSKLDLFASAGMVAFPVPFLATYVYLAVTAPQSALPAVPVTFASAAVVFAASSLLAFYTVLAPAITAHRLGKAPIG